MQFRTSPSSPPPILEVQFYDVNGKLLTVLKMTDASILMEYLLSVTDDHDLVHISRRGQIVEVCPTNFDIREAVDG